MLRNSKIMSTSYRSSSLPETRNFWIETATRIAAPVLQNLAHGTLRAQMPVESQPGENRGNVTHLEAFGRLLAGIAPWLELNEESARPWIDLARKSLDAATDPASLDFMNFTAHGQPLVDAAFLAQGLLRAPKVLWEPLHARVKENIMQALRSTRATTPHFNNWLCFSAMIETALFVFGARDWDGMRLDCAIRQHEQWYKGDGHYGDGPSFHADYYNSFVIHPMLVDIIRHIGRESRWSGFVEPFMTRSRRYAAVLERMISPEGTFPPMGRSLAYRFGAMQTLAQMALLHELPAGVSPAQVREALTAVIRRTIEASGSFDENGWLKIGFCGAQPGIGERYITTGSLYLCAVGLLPLGLGPSEPFWSDPPEDWTSKKAWEGKTFPIDHAIG